jgi:hypothetical protein
MGKVGFPEKSRETASMASIDPGSGTLHIIDRIELAHNLIPAGSGL